MLLKVNSSLKNEFGIQYLQKLKFNVFWMGERERLQFSSEKIKNLMGGNLSFYCDCDYRF